MGATRTIQTVVSILSAQQELVEGFPEIGQEIMDIPYIFNKLSQCPLETDLALT
jgi:hypothetical protein